MKLLSNFPSKTRNILVLIFGVLILAALLYYSCANREGFDGTVPQATEISAIPSDTPGATTTNPLVAKPQTKDIQAALDTASGLPETIQKDLKDALANPESSNLTLTDVNNIRKIAESDTIHSKSPENYETTVVAGNPGVITLKELKTLVSRIEEEQLRLANLRSSSATLLARQTQLEKLAADIRELIGAVERNEMKLEDVPIQPSSAEAFLKQFKGTNTPIPALIEPRATIANGIQAHVTPSAVPEFNTEALHGLLENTKYLKWKLDVKLEYDPNLAVRDSVVKRLEQMERRLTALAMSETPIPKDMYNLFVKELQTLNTLLVKNTESRKTSIDRYPTTYTRGLDGSTAEYPSIDKLNEAANVRDTASGNAMWNTSVSPDVFVRPGFIMNDATIQRRASASAFDDSLVGGPDYKKRSQELCRQIQGANLGDPVQFGCIANPDSVGPEYSWKGNYLMVCNRIGDTWGGWYPEMFGCPTYDPTQKFKGTMM